MNQPTTTSKQFSFSAGELSQRLLEQIQTGTTGYWQHQFDRLAAREQLFKWNLGVVNGQIVYSGNRAWSVQTLVRVIQRYIPRTSHHAVKLQLESLKRKTLEQALTPAQLLSQMKQLKIVDDAQLLKALHTKVLNDLDIYLLMGSGEAKFIDTPTLAIELPLQGFNPSVLLNEARHRQQQWSQVRQQIPSTNLLPLLDRAAMEAAKLTLKQQQRIEKLVQPGKNINDIAGEMSKDTLEIAQMFVELVGSGVVKFESVRENVPAIIMAIDDSAVMLAQFEHWVTALGYSVVVCQQAEMALATINQVRPAAIFIDINMPGISGFELIRQIRQQPELAKIPLAILTGEQKLSNKWQAQWTGCEFLTKPLTSASIIDFQAQLEELLPKLLGTTASNPTDNNSHN